jgi:hypothetical protein
MLAEPAGVAAYRIYHDKQLRQTMFVFRNELLNMAFPYQRRPQPRT